MAMTMADDYYAGDLDDVVHRLLPREILADVGIVDVAGGRARPSCEVRRRSDDHAALVEDLAAHLVGILGLDGAREKRAPAHPPYVRHEQGRVDYGSWAHVGGGQGGAGRHAPPPCWNKGAVPRRLPRFEPAAPVPVFAGCHPPAMRHGTGTGTGTGTGVFLPRPEAYLQNSASSASPIPRNGAKPPRMLRKEAVIIAMRQQQQQLMQLRAMATEMERQREAFAAAFQGCPALAAPRQWTY